MSVTFSTVRDLLKLIPVVNYFIAACPPFFSVVEYWFARVVQTSFIVVILLEVLLPTAIVLALLLCLHY